MSNIEKIKAEIERLKIDYLNRSYTFVPATMEQLLEFIDSLPECEETAKIPTEKYEEELNEEIQGFIDEYGYERGEDKILIAIVAHHFAEWQKEQMMKDAVEFECIGKRVKMTVQELINYYIDTECCDVADECGF